MKKLILFFLLLPLTGFCQKLTDYGVLKVRITEADKTTVAEINPISNDPKTESALFYFWYGSNKVHSTQGGYSGRLLNGEYSEYFPDKSLKVQGYFKKGLKTGDWKTWNESAKLVEETTWKNGLRDGPFVLYDEQGNVKQRGAYKNDLLNGEVTTMNPGGGKITVTYKKGIVVKEMRKPIWKRIPFINRKQK